MTIMLPAKAAFTPAPLGVHIAVLADVKTVRDENPFTGEEREQVQLTFQLGLTDLMGRRFLVFRRFNATICQGSHLRKAVEALRGKPFVEGEIGEEGFDIETLIGRSCQIAVEHRTSKTGKVFANITSVFPLGAGQVPITVEAYTRKPAPKKGEIQGELPLDRGDHVAR